MGRRHQVEVYEEYRLIPAALTNPLRAVIMGPFASLFRYADSKAAIGVGGYVPAAATAYPWPSRPAGGVVDSDSVRVFVDDAELTYFNDPIGGGQTITPVSGKTNQISADGSGGFISNGSGFPRIAGLKDRDVRIGDRVKLRCSVSSVAYSLDTYVQGILADPTSSAVAAAVAGSANVTTQAASAVVAQVAGPTTCNELQADVSAYNSWPDGGVNDVYTVTVIQGSTNGDLTTARLRITTASGLDDVTSLAPDFVSEMFDAGRRGLQLHFSCDSSVAVDVSGDDLIVGQSWTVTVADDYKTVIGTSGGTYVGAIDTTYVVKVTRGGVFAASDPNDRPLITATTAHGVDSSGPTLVSASATAYAVGSQGVTPAFSGSSVTGLRKGDIWTIGVTSAKNGRYSTILLANNMPTGMLSATDIDLTLAIRKDIELESTSWSISDTEITLAAAITAGDASLTDGGSPFTVPVTSGSIYVEYRAWTPYNCGTLQTINDVSGLDALPGPIDPDNPLKYGLFKALSTSNGTVVRFVPVCDPDDDSQWLNALGVLKGVRDVYGLVPLTHRQTVLDLVATHVTTQSGPTVGRWRVLWTALQATTAKPVVSAASSTDGGVVFATIADDAGTGGTQYTYVTVPGGNAQFVSSGVRPLDVIRINFGVTNSLPSYDTYVIDAVINEDTLRLVSGPATPIAVATKLEVWHSLNKDEQVQELVAQAGAYGNLRVRAVWPDTAVASGAVVDGYYLCASLAGMRSGIVPHQSMETLPLLGYGAVPRSTGYFDDDQLQALIDGGVWVVARDDDGNVYTRGAVTTDTLDLNHSQEMIVTNRDSISYYRRAALDRFIGRANAVPDVLSMIKADIIGANEFLKSNSYTPSLGAQLTDSTITGLKISEIEKDVVILTLDDKIPNAIGVIEVHQIV
jgi:hypothetical protein